MPEALSRQFKFNKNSRGLSRRELKSSNHRLLRQQFKIELSVFFVPIGLKCGLGVELRWNHVFEKVGLSLYGLTDFHFLRSWCHQAGQKMAPLHQSGRQALRVLLRVRILLHSPRSLPVLSRSLKILPSETMGT